MIIFSHPKFKFICISISIFIINFCIFSFVFINNFTEPLAGGSDIDIWEYMGFYIQKNISFSPFPNLNFNNNQVFYPYGTNSVFQPWSFERDIFYAILNIFFSGSWLKIYYLLTILVTALGSFILLFRDYGYARAMSFGYLVTYGNFYAIMEYPVHISKAVLHWTTLSFIADFLIIKRVCLGHFLSIRLILVRICLLFLSLGQDLGYIAGFSLTSFTVATLFLVVVFCYRYFKRKININHLSLILTRYKKELFTYPRISIFLILITIVAAYIYIPLILQIRGEIKNFDFTGISSGYLWVHPLRLFIPYFPQFNPANVDFKQIFNDIPENIGGGSPGWFLVIVAAVGLWKASKKIIYFPLILIFILFIFYHPIYFPTLNIFPWLAFNRKPISSIYPVILGIFALEFNFNGLHEYKRKLVTILLVGLACTEIYTAYSIKLNYNPYSIDKNFSFDQNFFTYMKYVKEQPGEAVLDWPFCAVGGNGVGATSLCPYYHLNSGIYSLRRFHEKKVMGQYFGRLHPSQIEPYLQAGWDKLFVPDSSNIFQASRQTRCFKAQEWEFFTNFYKFNDFAGINLYVNLLPEDCITEFYKRFCTPVIETVVPSAGIVQFIPKPLSLRNQVNLILGANLKFEPLLDLSESDLIKINSPQSLEIIGLAEIEKDDKSNNWRWALGPETVISFRLSKSQPLNLDFKFINFISSQNVDIEINGISINRNSYKQGENVEDSFNFQGVVGLNKIIFRYKDWNKNYTTFAPNDVRPIAIQFQKLEILKQN